MTNIILIASSLEDEHVRQPAPRASPVAWHRSHDSFRLALDFETEIPPLRQPWGRLATYISDLSATDLAAWASTG
uniref:LLM class flavin-dependent oxidoreductase n=1 Tax=Panagrellus redivivus TaxID=6233 RepID=A0A7E4VCW9_PANRE